MDSDALTYALRLLKRRDYTRCELERRLEARFGSGSSELIEWLEGKGYLDDRRFTVNFLESHRQWGPLRMHAELDRRGVGEGIQTQVLAGHSWPRLRDVVGDRMARMRVVPPLRREDAARISRMLGRLGFDPHEVEEELGRLL